MSLPDVGNRIRNFDKQFQENGKKVAEVVNQIKCSQGNEASLFQQAKTQEQKEKEAQLDEHIKTVFN